MFEGGSQEMTLAVPVPEKRQLMLKFGGGHSITEDSIKVLKDKIEVCKSALQYAKMLIEHFKDCFEKELEELKCDGNELIERNYKEGLKILDNYYSILLTIETNLKAVDVAQLARDVLNIEKKTDEVKSRYQMLETRVKAIMEMLALKMGQLQQDKEAILNNTPLQISHHPKPLVRVNSGTTL